MDYGFMAMSRILEEKKTDFTAVYAISDSIAIGACKAITEYGMKIPEDYSVAGFDGLDIAHYYNPTLTTIRQPVEEMAEATIKILFDVVSNHADHQLSLIHISHCSRLTDPLAISHGLSTAAI